MLCSAPLHIQLKIAETGLCSLPFCPSGPVSRTAEHHYSAIQDCYFPAIAHVKQLKSQTASLIHKMSKEKGTDRSGEAAHRTASP